MVKIFVLIAVSIALFCAYPIAAQSPTTQNEIKKLDPKQEGATTDGSPANISQHQERTNNQQNPPNKPMTLIEENKTRIEENTTKRRPNYEAENLEIQRQLSKATKTISDFTIGLVVVGVLQAIIFLYQVFLLRGTLKATTTAANAATKGAKVAETALHVAERAYLHVPLYEIINFTITTIDEGIKVRSSIVNSGHTPGLVNKTYAQVSVFNNIPEIPAYGEGELVQIVVPPDAPCGLIIIGKKPISIEEYHGVMEEGYFILIWGKIIYTDKFKKVHIAGFGVKWGHDGNFTFNPVPGYNYDIEYGEDENEN